jgi:hypothetical protein
MERTQIKFLFASKKAGAARAAFFDSVRVICPAI